MKKLFTISLLVYCVFSYSVYSQWTQVGQVFNTGGYPRISVVDSNVVWISSGLFELPRIYRTVNGGTNWTSIQTTGLPDEYLVCIAARDSMKAFIGTSGGQTIGGNAKLFGTTNAGVNWTFIDSTGGPLGFFDDIIFSKTVKQFGIALSDPPDGKGNPYYLSITTNGGMNWTVTHPPGVPFTFGVFYGAFAISPIYYGFVLVNTKSVGSMNSYITSNGGLSWYEGSDSAWFELSSSADIVFSDNETDGIMISDVYLPNIKRTTNRGVSWDSVNTMSDIIGFSTASWVSGTNTVLICASSSSSGNHVIRSDNAGLNWTGQNTSNINNLMEVDNIRYGDKVYAYAVSNEGKIIKSVQSVTPIGINSGENEILSGYSLSQNYPNPFNPKTIINFDLPQDARGESQVVKLIVYDISGKEIATLINQKFSAGSYEVEFNGENFSSGIYFYKLDAGGFTDTKRMVLIK